MVKHSNSNTLGSSPIGCETAQSLSFQTGEMGMTRIISKSHADDEK